MNWQILHASVFNYMVLVFWIIAFFVGYKSKSWLWAVGLWALNLIIQFALNLMGLMGYALRIGLLEWGGVLLIITLNALGLALMILAWWIGKKVEEK